jgi:Fusaric acid resistance protein-like/FUSC-like inner membrane protein yccS
MTSMRARTVRLREAVVPDWLTEAMPDWLTEAVRPRPAPVPWGEMLRTALAICVPLSVGIAVGRRDIGLLPALGGLVGTMIDTGGPYMVRVKRVLIAGVFGGAAGLVVGELIHGRGWIAVAALVVVAGVSAVLSRLGSTGSVTGLQLLVYSSLGLGPFGALRPWWHTALGFVVGVGWALLLIVPGWLLSPRSAEQRSVAAVYHALAGYLRAIGTPHAVEARRAGTAALNTAYDTLLTARSTAGGRSRRLMHLMAVLNASHPLSEAVTALCREGTRPPPLLGDTIDRLADAIAAGAVLQSGPRLGRTLLDSLPWDSLHWDGLHWDGLHRDSQGDGRRGDGQLPGVPPIPPPWSASPGSLALRDAMAGLARAIAWTPEALPEPAARTSLRNRVRGVLGSTLDRLRGGWLGQTFAIRLMICIGVAAATSEVLPLQRSYWVVLTVAIVLKPDYGSVFARALQRGIGTIVGAVVGAVILAVVPYGPLLLIRWPCWRRACRSGAAATSASWRRSSRRWSSCSSTC